MCLAIPSKIVKIKDNVATIDVDGVKREASLLLLEDPKVGDLKTTKKTWPENRINQEIQPILYSFVHEHEKGIKPEFIYHILIALKRETKLQEQKLVPTKKHYRALFAKLTLFCKMVETGLFPPANPSEWYCSPKWCGYYQTCKYVGN